MPVAKLRPSNSSADLGLHLNGNPEQESMNSVKGFAVGVFCSVFCKALANCKGLIGCEKLMVI